MGNGFSIQQRLGQFTTCDISLSTLSMGVQGLDGFGQFVPPSMDPKFTLSTYDDSVRVVINIDWRGEGGDQGATRPS